jgi:hypothetical protein
MPGCVGGVPTCMAEATQSWHVPVVDARAMQSCELCRDRGTVHTSISLSTLCALRRWINSSAVRVECPIVRTTNGNTNTACFMRLALLLFMEASRPGAPLRVDCAALAGGNNWLWSPASIIAVILQCSSFGKTFQQHVEVHHPGIGLPTSGRARDTVII